MNRKPPDRGKQDRARPDRKAPAPKARKLPDYKEAAKRAALNALKRTRRQADRAGVKLSEWEGEFLESVAERVKTYGRAFADPEKGAPGTPFSVLQGMKLREIAAKAKGEKREFKRKPFKRRGKPDDE